MSAMKVRRAVVHYKTEPPPTPEYKSLYSLKRWKRYSRRRLTLHPFCVVCEEQGETRLADLTDHITPHRGNLRRFWSTSNHQSMCHHHHGIKSASERGTRE